MAGGATAKNAPAWFQTVGTLLALCSGLFIGLSLILQKKGLLDSNAQRLASGNEFSYLKSNYWWFGIACMVIGEFSNFAAYAFSPAIIVTPLGAVSVVVSAVLSILFLGEQLNFSGACGIVLCIIGSIIIVFHGPRSTATETLDEFYIFLVKPGFIIYCVLAGGLLVWLYWKIVPRYGTTQPIVYVSMTSIAGAFLVNAAQGRIIFDIRTRIFDRLFDSKLGNR
jgi:magnesium transporter